MMENSPHNISWFWNELKRRKVIRVIVAYIAAAFLLIELILIISPLLQLHSWVLPLAFILLGTGFILSVWVSWVYDRTSAGIVKTRKIKEEPEEELEKLINAHEWKVTTLVSLVVIVALVVFHVLTENRRASQITETQEIPVKDAVDSDVYLIVEDMPQFAVSGYRDFRDYIDQEIIYPERCREEGISGRVYVQFVVKSDGSVDDIKVVRGINEELNEEAVRVVQSSPLWQPGKHKGKAVNVSYSFPVVFSLE